MAAGQRRSAPPRRPSNRDFWLALPAGLGAILSAYLVYTRAAHAPTYCPLGSGCDVVQSSRYGTVFGIPVALLGLLYYVVILVLAVRRLSDDRRWAIALPVAGMGVGASIVFTAVQQTAIRATCSLCLISALLTVAILVLPVIRRPARPRRATWAWTSASLIAAVAFLAAGYAASAPQAAESDYATGLARHLAATGVKFYGAYWCPHCKDQKALFGKAAALLPYIECDPRSPAGEPQVCTRANIRAFPTWDIENRRFEGVLSLEELARLTGYPPPP